MSEHGECVRAFKEIEAENAKLLAAVGANAALLSDARKKLEAAHLQLKGMTGERDSEREIAVGWEKKCEALELQIDEFKEGEAQDRQVMDEFAREFFTGQEGNLWLPGFTLKKLLEMIRDRFAEKPKGECGCYPGVWCPLHSQSPDVAEKRIEGA